MNFTILQGDCIERVKTLPCESVDCVVTSPPYWNLRDYGVEGQIGLEETPEEFVFKMVEVFREIRRVLKNSGTCWINLGDSYAGSWGAQSKSSSSEKISKLQVENHPKRKSTGSKCRTPGLKPKDLCGIPWRVAFALQEDGWYLRSDIIWSKPNPMPESVYDRPTKSHEYLFLLTKSQKYFYDHEAIKEPSSYDENWSDRDRFKIARSEENKIKHPSGWARNGTHKSSDWATETKQGRSDKQRGHSRKHAGFNDRWDKMTREEQAENGRNKRSVWSIPTFPYPEAHFATYPPDLIKPCILAGCPAGGIVLDPFGGSGTTAQVALELGRSAILIELNKNYVNLIEKRLMSVTPGLALT